MWQRLKNLWKLSGYEIPKASEHGKRYDELPIGTQVVTALIKRPTQKAQFIPRVQEKPIDKITKIGEEHA